MNDTKLFYNELKTKRESQNLTLEEISDFTKIDIKFLIAIEKGDFSCLPSVYMRLFLRSYCEYISVDTEQALNDFEFHTHGTTTEKKSFISPSNTDQTKNLTNEKELNLPQVPTTKIITVAITVFALALTFFFISRIDNNSDSQDNSNPQEDQNDVINNDLEEIPSFSKIPNKELLTNEVFKIKNIDRSGEVNLTLDAPFNFRIEALTETKITVTNETNGKQKVTRKILPAGGVEVFEIESKVSFDFWSAQHIKCSLNGIDLTQYFSSEDKLIRGWFATVNRKLSYRLFNYPSSS